jgi:hypothetical protein
LRPLAPASPLRGRAIERINAHYEAYLGQGFPTADFDGQPEPETLQCRNELDRTNWIGLLIKAQAVAVIASQTEDPDAVMAQPCDPPIRCSSNRMYRPAWSSVLARMYALLDQAATAQANWWRLKDAARSAETREALQGLDLDEGWP